MTITVMFKWIFRQKRLNFLLAKRPCTDFVRSGGDSQCRPDGLFETKQCDKTGTCWCVNVLNGQPVHSSKTEGQGAELDCGGECLGGTWTRWFNTDTPQAANSMRRGDFETLDRARLESRRVCARPVGFKVAIDNGDSAQGLSVSSTNETVEYVHSGATMGIKCANNDQADGGSCSDYKIKFCCPLVSVCHWSEWSDWSDCNRSCGGTGMRHRARQILFKPDEIDECPGRDYEVEACGSDGCCASDCAWSEWGIWSECSLGCHGGTQKRTRHIGNNLKLIFLDFFVEFFEFRCSWLTA